MLVKVKLQLTFEAKVPGGQNPFEMEIASGSNVARVLEKLGIPENTPKIVVINGRLGAMDRILQEGDKLVVFPPLEGG